MVGILGSQKTTYTKQRIISFQLKFPEILTHTFLIKLKMFKLHKTDVLRSQTNKHQFTIQLLAQNQHESDK